MANYCCTIRTNYFHVKDEDSFRNLMSRVYGCEDSVELWEEKDKNGKTVFGFGVYGGISGLRDTDTDDIDDDSAYDDFIDRLQESVAEDDAIIILEAGSENMRYIVGSATIITSSGVKYMNITDLAVAQAAEMIGNSMWGTKCEY